MEQNNEVLLAAIRGIVKEEVQTIVNQVVTDKVTTIVSEQLAPMKDELLSIKRKLDMTFDAVGELKVDATALRNDMTIVKRQLSELDEKTENLDNNIDAMGAYLRNNLDSRVEKLESSYSYAR